MRLEHHVIGQIGSTNIITIYYRNRLEIDVKFMYHIDNPIEFYIGGSDGSIFNFNGGSYNYVLFSRTPID